MSVQYIHDNKGKPTGVFIPIADWKNLKKKYSALQLEEEKPTFELQDWHKELLDKRLEDFEKKPDDVISFSELIKRVKKANEI